MKQLKRFAFLLLTLTFAGSLSVEAKKKIEPATIYAFTYGTCFSDSTVYLSTVQQLVGAKLENDSKFLARRSAYSATFKTFLDTKYDATHTCAVFFATNRTKLEKKYLKLKKKHQKKGYKVTEIPVTDFTLPALRALPNNL